MTQFNDDESIIVQHYYLRISIFPKCENREQLNIYVVMERARAFFFKSITLYWNAPHRIYVHRKTLALCPYEPIVAHANLFQLYKFNESKECWYENWNKE